MIYKQCYARSHAFAWECIYRPQAQNITCTDIEIIVDLVDGRRISAPLVWFPRLAKASQEALSHWELLGDGEGIYWPDVDEDLSVQGLLTGVH